MSNDESCLNVNKNPDWKHGSKINEALKPRYCVIEKQWSIIKYDWRVWITNVGWYSIEHDLKGRRDDILWLFVSSHWIL